jgi:hypothetical protein
LSERITLVGLVAQLIDVHTTRVFGVPVDAKESRTCLSEDASHQGLQLPKALARPFKRVRHDFNHGIVFGQRVDLAQPIGPQFVPIGQQHLEQTPLALFALNHARSFDESLRAGSAVREIDRRNRRVERLVAAGRRASVQCQ